MNHDHSNGMDKHMLIMLACCLVPIALIVAVSVTGISLGPLSALLPYALVLMCPLMMIFMMRGMTDEHSADHVQHNGGDASAASAGRVLGHDDALSTAPTPRLASNAEGAIETTASRGRCH